MQINQAIASLSQGKDLSPEHCQGVLIEIMQAQPTPAQIGAFLMGLACKGVTEAELRGGALALRELMSPVNIDAPAALDTCGTGGDGKGLFNISTASAFVVAAAGGKVAKHGNKAVSSSTGSADVLQAAGAAIMLNPEQLAELLRSCGLCFMFAPLHHQALKNVADIRKQLGVRTLFNMLGPLANPARVRRQIVGVFDAKLQQNYAQALSALGCDNALIVHSQDGLDELSSAARNDCLHVLGEQIRPLSIDPRDYGIKPGDLNELRADDANSSLDLLQAALRASNQQAFDIVRLNAGAALYVAGLVADISEGVQRASACIESGAAWDKLQQYVSLSQQLASADA